MSYLMGIDVGTSSTKCIVVDQQGRLLGRGKKDHVTRYPQPGWVEQDPGEWVEGVKFSVRQAIEESEVDWSSMAAIGITHQRITIVPVDQAGEPLIPSIVWNDTRCSEEADWAGAEIGKESIFQRTGYLPGIWSIYKVLWLKNHHPDVYHKTYLFLTVADWLIYQMTGNLVTSEGSAVTTGALDIHHKRQWDEHFFKELGLRNTIFVPDILPAGTEIGRITTSGEEQFGIPAGIPVVTTAGDQPCGTFGAGQFEVGSLSINGGTSCTSEVLSKDVPLLRNPHYFVEISPTGDYLLENSVYSGGSTLMKWFVQHFGAIDEMEARAQGKNRWEYIYSRTEEAPVGNLGLFLIPFLGGSGAPYWNLDARGALLGLTCDHGRPHLIRAILEGLAYESRRTAQMMERDLESSITYLITYGGSAQSRIWNQIFSDIFNKKVLASLNPETTALGAAMCAAAGAKLYPDVAAAGRGMAQSMEEYSPDEEKVAFYQTFYEEVYCGLYDSMVDKLARGRNLALQYMKKQPDSHA